MQSSEVVLLEESKPQIFNPDGDLNRLSGQTTEIVSAAAGELPIPAVESPDVSYQCLAFHPSNCQAEYTDTGIPEVSPRQCEDYYLTKETDVEEYYEYTTKEPLFFLDTSNEISEFEQAKDYYQNDPHFDETFVNFGGQLQSYSIGNSFVEMLTDIIDNDKDAFALPAISEDETKLKMTPLSRKWKNPLWKKTTGFYTEFWTYCESTKQDCAGDGLALNIPQRAFDENECFKKGQFPQWSIDEEDDLAGQVCSVSSEFGEIYISDPGIPYIFPNRDDDSEMTSSTNSKVCSMSSLVKYTKEFLLDLINSPTSWVFPDQLRKYTAYGELPLKQLSMEVPCFPPMYGKQDHLLFYSYLHTSLCGFDGRYSRRQRKKHR